MADEHSYTEGTLSTDVPPPSRPRDQGGKFIAESRAAPEPMFGLRPVEGDPETGDTSDGGDDPRFRSIERENRGQAKQNRRSPTQAEGQGDEFGESGDQRGRHASSNNGRNELTEEESEDASSEPVPSSASEQEVDGADESDEAEEKFPVVIDGEEREVSLKEALAGYVRTATFHKRMEDLNSIQGNMELDAGRLQEGWRVWHKAVQDYEEDFQNLLPPALDWDREFAINPSAARDKQRSYQILYEKLSASRAARAAREGKDAQEAQQKLKRYAEWGFARFVQMNQKSLKTQRDIDKNVESMRRTAVALGFSDQEVTTVFDPRMLTILLKASKYDRMQAAQVRAEDPSRGRTLTPGAATPRIGNAPRKGLDEALRRQQQTGRLDDTADVMSHFLRG